MNRRDFIGGLAGVTALAACPSLAGLSEFRGRVSGGGRPLAGVAVSDGLNVALTDAEGCYRLPSRPEARFLDVTVPSGWRACVRYLPVQEGRPTYDFTLEPWACSAADRPLSFVQIADSEIYRVSGSAKRMVEHVKRIADGAEAAFVIHTGDICKPGGLRAHIEVMNDRTMGRPVFYCVGNHDLTKEGGYGEWLFESLYGPAWHSFDACGFHFVVTPMSHGDGRPSYDAKRLAAWLKNDLAAVPKSRPVVLFNHSFGDAAIFDMADVVRGTVRLADFDVTDACNLVGVIHGHQHTNHFRRFGKIAAIQTSNPWFGGGDSSPASVRIVKADRDGRLYSDLRRSPTDVWPVITQAVEGCWIAKASGPIYLGQPVTDGTRVFVGTLDPDGLGTGSVTAFDLQTGKVAWTMPMPNSVRNQLALFKGLVIAQDSNGTVHALKGDTGHSVWTRDPDVVMHFPHQLGVGLDEKRGLVFVELDKKLTAIDALTGEVRWKSDDWKVGRWVASHPVCLGDSVIAEASWDGIFCHDAATGRLLWKRRDSGVERKGDQGLRWRAGTVACAGDEVFATGENGFFVLDAKTGGTRRNKGYSFTVTSTSTPLLTEKLIYTGTAGSGLIAIDREALHIVWKGKVDPALVVSGSYKMPPKGQIATSPLLIDKETVCAAAGDGTVRFWDAKTGAEKKCLRTGAPHFSTPLRVGNRLVVADFAGYVRTLPV